MKTKGQNNLIDEGKDNWERTDEYNKRVREIRCRRNTSVFYRLKKIGSRSC